VKIVILRQAYDDVTDAFEFYESQEPGAGDYFEDTIAGEIDSLAFYGGIHPICYGFYRLLAHRFPYAIFYRLINQQVHVVAVLDCRRDPRWMRRQLQKR